MRKKSPTKRVAPKSRARATHANREIPAGREGGAKSQLDNRMMVHAKDLGAIDQADFELAPLTIIAGPNSSGKSYLTNALYGFLRLRHDEELGFSLLQSERSTNHPFFTSKNKSELMDVGATRIKFTHVEFLDNARQFYDFLSKAFSSKLGHVFNLNSNKLGKTMFSFTPSEVSLTNCYQFLRDKTKPLSLGDIVISMGSDRARGGGSLKVEIHAKNKGLSKNISILDVLAPSLDFMLFSTILYRTRMFTSDRSGIALFYKELDHSKSSLLQKLQKSDITSEARLDNELARYVHTTHDNINYARDMHRTIMKQSSLAPDPDEKYYKLIEKMIGGGFCIENDEIKLKSLPDDSRKFDIPFHTASSAARELALLYFYLKHDARKDDMVFIDEPEAHLDPKNQVRLAWLVSNCVNAGLNIFVTTHSEMLLKELNNLLMLGSKELDRESFFSLHPRYEKLTPLQPAQVKAYTCDNHTLSPCEMNSRGMVIPTIDDTIATLASVSVALDNFIPE